MSIRGRAVGGRGPAVRNRRCGKGWDELCRQAPANTLVAYEEMRRRAIAGRPPSRPTRTPRAILDTETKGLNALLAAVGPERDLVSTNLSR